jgi:seryl-tRNA synthetase
VPPVLIIPEMMKKMGYIDTEEDKKERYFLEKDNLYLVGTAEQSIGPMHSGEVFKQKDLPRRYVGFSSCFREEAGSYGRDTRGILRVHQFDKIEMFSFTKPEDSVKEHKFFLSLEEKLMQKLKIPYQVVQIVSGDLGIPVASKYDIEAWMPGQDKYRETHSTSNCTDFQARRLNIRYKDKFGKFNFVHTINGTAFAIGRTIIAILENYQRRDGKVEIPKVLQKYLGFKKIG